MKTWFWALPLALCACGTSFDPGNASWRQVPDAPATSPQTQQEQPEQPSQFPMPAQGLILGPQPQADATDNSRRPIEPTAKRFDLVDGAVVCGSYDVANWITGEINMARHARLSLSTQSRQQAELIHGYDYGAEPKLSDYGCLLVPAGTKLTVAPGNYVPVVSGVLQNGRRFKGVTIPAMIAR